MYYPHEHNAKLAAQHVKTQMANAKDRLKRVAGNKPLKEKKS